MPKNKVTDPITDQEIAFARLVLAGGMTDRRAAEAVGLNPDTAAYTKSKPQVRAYMLDHRAAVQQQLVEQEADLSRLPRLAVGRAEEETRRKNQWRKQILDRLWEIANLPVEATRNSITGQLKAISMIVAMEGLIPDRRAGSAQKNSVPAPETYPAACPPRPAVGAHPQQATPAGPQAPAEEGADHGVPGPTPASAPVGDTLPDRFPSHPAVSVPDTRVPFSIQKNRFGPHR
jgi:hypothetical protein